MKKKRSDSRLLNWLDMNGAWHAYGNRVGVLFLPTELEDGQDLRGAINAAMDAQEKGGGRGV